MPIKSNEPIKFRVTNEMKLFRNKQISFQKLHRSEFCAEWREGDDQFFGKKVRSKRTNSGKEKNVGKKQEDKIR
jgi:murein L,D-transpeptidase YafK